MTYQVFARKWRPKNFTQLIGQSAVSKALIHALNENRLHHSYLFTGTRGVGKTTIARILAKCLNCEQGVSSQPCGLCSSCIEIDEGRFPDLIEVDAASRTRIEDTKELLENVVYAPVRGRYKIYLIDEVHMLSGHSFNALLKTLEEPPAHVKFIFATTEPERIPVTVLSRCIHFNLRPISTIDLVKQLETILIAENIRFEVKALQLLAKAGKGSVRDCLSLLEQAIGIGQGQLQALSVADMLGLHAHALMLPLMQALCSHNMSALFEITNKLAQSGADFERVLEAVLENLHALSMMQMVPNAKVHIQTLKEIDNDILELHPHLKPEQTQLYYQIALLGKRDLGLMPDAARAFEMVLLRMLCFQLTGNTIQKPVFSPIQAPIQISTQPAVQPPVEQQQAPAPVSNVSNGIPNWRELITQLALTGIIKLLAQNCVIHKWAPPQVELILEPSSQPFFSVEREKELSQAFTAHFKQDIKVSITIKAKQANTLSPAMEVLNENTEKQNQAKIFLENNETVKTLIDVFDAKLMKLTLRDK